jgi:hypothetical protein
MFLTFVDGWLETLASWFPSLATLGSVASLLSLILTAYVLIELRRIRSFYLFKARVPDLIGRLSQHSSNLSNYLSDFDNSLPDIVKELAVSEAVMTSLTKKLDGDPLKSVKALLQSTNEFRTHNTKLHFLKREKEGLRGIYVEMANVVEVLQQSQEDTKFER